MLGSTEQCNLFWNREEFSTKTFLAENVVDDAWHFIINVGFAEISFKENETRGICEVQIVLLKKSNVIVQNDFV